MRYMYFFTDGNVKSMHLPTCSQQTGLELTIPYLRCDVSDSTWSMRDEDRRGLGWGPNLLHGVEVLGHQNHVHDILWRGPRNILRESKNTVSQPIHYSLALSCDTQTGQVLGFCITALLICSIFSASAFTVAANLSLAAVSLIDRNSSEILEQRYIILNVSWR